MDSKIIVNSKLNKSLKKAVLWHEVVHVVLEGIGESEIPSWEHTQRVFGGLKGE